MRRRFLCLALVLCATSTPEAAADPGAVDRTFGTGGVVRPKGSASVSDVTALPNGRLAYSADRLRLLGPTGRPLSAPQRRRGAPPFAAPPFAVLPDGRFVVAQDISKGYTTMPRRIQISRRLVSGKLDPSFGTGGRVLFRSPGLPIFAAGDDGRLAQTGGTDTSPTVILRRPDGSVDPVFGERAVDAQPAALLFDVRNRLIVASKPSIGSGIVRSVSPGVVRRLSADGTPDPAFTPQPVAYNPGRVLTSPSGARIFVAPNGYTTTDPLFLDEGGRALPLSPSVRRVLPLALGHVFDARDRLLIFVGRRLLRISADGQQVESLRSRLPGSAFGVRPLDAAVDRRGRIVIGGYRLLEDAIDPAECNFCREDVARTGGIVIRLEGGDRRIAIIGKRRSGTVAIWCLPAALRRCSGTLTLRSPEGRTMRRRIRLAAGATRSFTVPRSLGREARSITVEARAVDATGELFTARRSLGG